MADLDYRSRFDADVRTLEFVDFHERELPARLAANHAALAARGVAVLGLPPLALAVAGRSYTYLIQGETMHVVPGDDAAAAVAVLDAEAFSDLMQDLRSTVALVIGDAVHMTRGSQRTFVEWEPVLRAMLDGRTVHEAGAIDFRGRDGAALDLRRSFSVDDPPDELAHFLGEAGFLHLRGVFTSEEMAEISRDIDRAIPRYTSDDGRSWWARTAAGDHRPVRLQYFQEQSELTATLLRDPRYLGIADLTVNDHGQRVEGNAIEALVKPIGVVEGISDVSWHKDCSLGRHSYECCSITAGISVTDSDDASGQLCVVAGSHRALVPLRGVRDDLDLPRIGLPTHAGDVTVHLSCTLHMSIPPKTAERRVLYSGFRLPAATDDRSAQAQERLRQVRERAPRKVVELKGTSISDEPEMEQMNRFDTRGVRSVK